MKGVPGEFRLALSSWNRTGGPTKKRDDSRPGEAPQVARPGKPARVAGSLVCPREIQRLPGRYRCDHRPTLRCRLHRLPASAGRPMRAVRTVPAVLPNLCARPDRSRIASRTYRTGQGLGSGPIGSDRDWRPSSGPLPGLPPLRSGLSGRGALWGAADRCALSTACAQACRVTATNVRMAHRTPTGAVGADGRLPRGLAAAATCRPAFAATAGLAHPPPGSIFRVRKRCRSIPRLPGPQLRNAALCSGPPVGRRHRVDLHGSDRANLLR